MARGCTTNSVRPLCRHSSGWTGLVPPFTVSLELALKLRFLSAPLAAEAMTGKALHGPVQGSEVKDLQVHSLLQRQCDNLRLKIQGLLWLCS